MDHLESRMFLKNVAASNKNSTSKYGHLQGWCLNIKIKIKYKNKVPDVSDFNQNIENSCKPELKASELKDNSEKNQEN